MDKIEKFLRKLSASQRQVILKLLISLKSGVIPQGLNFKALQGQDNIYRIRLGKMRIIIYKKNDLIGILEVTFRKDAYR